MKFIDQLHKRVLWLETTYFEKIETPQYVSLGDLQPLNFMEIIYKWKIVAYNEYYINAKRMIYDIKTRSKRINIVAWK